MHKQVENLKRFLLWAFAGVLFVDALIIFGVLP